MTGPGDTGYGPAFDAIEKRLDALEANQNVIVRELLGKSCHQRDELMRMVVASGCVEVHPQPNYALPSIDRLVDAFLAWPLPDSVNSDGCVTRRGVSHRSGTNLLTAIEARQMFEYLLEKCGWRAQPVMASAHAASSDTKPLWIDPESFAHELYQWRGIGTTAGYDKRFWIPVAHAALCKFGLPIEKPEWLNNLGEQPSACQR